MQSKILKVMGEGGVHSHRFESPIKTALDGFHKHLFFFGGRLIMTQLDGAHWHPVDPAKNKIGSESNRHTHKVALNTQDGVVEFQTGTGSGHQHEIQTGGTTLSGLHVHMLELNGEAYMSLLPGDLLEEVQSATKSDSAFKDFKVRKSEDPMELDFQLIKRLNRSDFRDILRLSVERAQLKNMGGLVGGFQVESLILYRTRFSDIGVARRFVMDNGLDVISSEEIPVEGVFTFQIRSRDRFQGSTLVRVRVSDGVEAVVGLLAEDMEHGEDCYEASAADSLTENAVQPEKPESEHSDTLSSFSDKTKAGDKMLPKKKVGKRVPPDSASNEEKRKAQKERSSRYGISALENGTENLSYPSGQPQTEDMYADPVNLKFPVDTAARTRNAVARFPQASGYSQSDKKVIAERIARRALDLGISIGEGSTLYALLPEDMKRRFKKDASDLSKKFERVSGMFTLKKEVEKKVEILKRASIDKAAIQFDIFKKQEDKRLVTGPILIPDQFDLQGDIISKAEIESAIHNYMIKLAFQNDSEFLQSLGLSAKSERGFMHSEFNRKIAFVEMYIAPSDFQLNGRLVRQGTAIGTAKVFDDEVWNLVKAGKITGFSIGGRAKVIPLE